MKVVFLLCPRMLATSVSLPLEQLRAAEAIARVDKPLKQRSESDLSIRLASIDGKPVTTHTGFDIAADDTAESIESADLVYIPALWRNPVPVINQLRPILPWLKRLYHSGTTLAGVGTGCCFLAEAGLLDHRPATTHWHYFDTFQKRYPLVQLKRQYFITQAGNLFCTGSVNALADLTVLFIQRYFSSDVASHVERHFFHEIRRAYQSSTTLLEEDGAHPDEDVIQVQIWLQDNFNRDINMQALARQFGMSPRTFNRRFKAATGSSPLHYLQKQRTKVAKELLQTSNLSVTEIMYRIGYHDAAHFTRLFKAAHGVTPSQYRTTVRAKMFRTE